jgi:hypothetical protein
MRAKSANSDHKCQTRGAGRLMAKVSAISLLAVSAAFVAPYAFNQSQDIAWAQNHNGGQGGQGGSGGHDGGDDSGHTSGQGKGPQVGQSGAGAAGGGQGQGAPDSDSDGRGPKYGQGSGTAGGKPVWAQEGIPDVELGRLNVARSPENVLLRAFDEALASFTPEMVDFYNMTLAEAITALSFDFDSLSYIDSPLQNLALLKDALDGSSVLSSVGVTNSTSTLDAIFLGVASDKTVPITTDTVLAVTTILGYDLTLAQATSLAADAEAIRIAVLAGHG